MVFIILAATAAGEARSCRREAEEGFATAAVAVLLKTKCGLEPLCFQKHGERGRAVQHVGASRRGWGWGGGGGIEVNNTPH